MKEKQFEKILKSLANKRRLLILSFLKKNEEATVGNIAENIKLSFRATSKHLSVLSLSDIVDKEQRGPYIFYSINRNYPDLAKAIIQFL
ncbi:MAG: metalloregulator ArsR/SmtB family transcription factor [Patescibacteria group bacterium]